MIGTCRDPKKLTAEDIVPGLTYLPLDLTESRSIDALARRVRAVDLLVNSAGAGMIGPVEEVKLDQLFFPSVVQLHGHMGVPKMDISFPNRCSRH